MKSVGKSLPFIILVAGLLGSLGLSSLRKDPPSAESEQLAPMVRVTPVERCEGGFQINVDGQVIPYREISLAARVAGQIVMKSPHALAGNYVRKGALLFEIDPSDYELEARRLRETVNVASSSIEEADVEKANVQELIELAEERLSLQRRDVARYEDLRKKNAVSDSQLEAARNSELQSLDALQTYKNRITLLNASRNRLLQQKESASTNLEQAILNLSRTKIVSPADGVVRQDLAEEDDYVQVGSPLVRIEDTSKVEVRFSMRMEQLRWLWSSAGPRSTVIGDSQQASYQLPQVPVRIRTEIDGHHFGWPARLERYDGAGINAATRTVAVIATVDDPTAVQPIATEEDALPLPGPPTLLSGSYVTVEIPVGASLDLVKIDATGLRPEERVWAYRDGKLSIQKVKVAQTLGEQIVLFVDPQRLKVGDQIVVSPLTVIDDGMENRLEQSPPSQSEEAMAARGGNQADAL